MADDQPTAPPAPADAPVNVINLQIVSPSVGVNTLIFPALAASTTVAQLKDKIRETLPLRPAADQQRLIHRGRLLARDTESLQDVFGEEAARTGDQQTLHLVVRDSDHDSRSQTPSWATPIRDQSPAPGTTSQRPDSQPQPHPHHHHHHHHHQHTTHRGFPIRNATPTIPNQYPIRNPTPGLPNPAVAQIMQMHQQLQPQANHLQQLQQQQQQNWLNMASQLQREAAYRQLLVQQQRDRAAMGLHGVQDNGNGLQGQGNMDPLSVAEGIRRRMTPTEGHAAMSATASQHGAGPTSNPSRAQLTPADIQNIFRGADTAQATQTITNAMHRSASGASIASMASLANLNGPIQPIQPGVTTPLFPGGSRHPSRAATPDPFGRPGGFPAFSSRDQTHSQQSQGQPEVYILSSPTGPRGLLINNSDIYVTPATRNPNLQQFSFFPPPQRPGHQPLFPFTPLPNPQVQPQNQPAVVPLPGQRIAQVPQQQPQAQVRLERAIPAPGRHGHPNNPGAGALVAAAWPHVWLIIRLVIFVWWFTSSDASWSRWLAMVAIAIIVFIVNTGILDGVVNQVWNPIRQHLEGLLPLGDANPPQRRRPPPGFPPDPNDRDAGATPVLRPDAPAQAPDPAQVAARLVAQRRHDNTHWLLDQVRRLERAGLLFLASIAPGVAERHIAHLEAQERIAERQRRDAEEAAARLAEDVATPTATAAATNQQPEQQPAAEGNDQAQNEGEGQTGAPAPQQRQAPLIEI